MIPTAASVSTIEIGIVSSPMPMKSTGRFQYIRHDAVIVWPHERRRARWSGAVGRQAVFEASQATSAVSAIRMPTTSAGLFASRRSRFEPRMTAPQKKSVAFVPSTPPTGIA